MAHYLLIARFTLDDIPLALLTDKFWAEKHAKDLQANPSLLDTKWKKALDAWPAHAGGFAGAVVLHIDVTGDPVGVTFDSTEDGEVEQPPEPQPPQSMIPVPEGYVEITDPNHKLRPHVDFYLSLNWSPGEWMPITETDAVLISDLGTTGRFCCPATKHPDLQGTPIPTETDELKVLREANDILVKTQIALSNEIWELRKQHTDLLNENNTLVATRTQLHKTVGELLEERAEWMANNAPALEARYRQCEECVKKLQADLSISNAQISDLRRLNEDLNHRLNSTLARASHATDLESRIRKMAINFVEFQAKLRERRIWSSVFATEKQMSPAYTQALKTVDIAFTDVFVSFLQSFPHVQPDMPDEWQIGPEETDDDDGTTD